MKRGPIAWGIATVILVAYSTAARVESHVTETKIALMPGNVADLDLFRLTDDKFRFDLYFKTQGLERRPELGNWNSDDSWKKTGLLKLNPGAEVKIEASRPRAAPVIFDAMPMSAVGIGINIRNMTANLPIAPGIYRWGPPDSTPFLKLSPGFNHVRLKIQKVGQPLIGEVVTIIILPPLGFYEYFPNTHWLWPALLLWPLFAIVQILWAVGLVWAAYEERRRVRGQIPHP